MTCRLDFPQHTGRVTARRAPRYPLRRAIGCSRSVRSRTHPHDARSAALVGPVPGHDAPNRLVCEQHVADLLRLLAPS
jgi:hypothetical protein